MDYVAMEKETKWPLGRVPLMMTDEEHSEQLGDEFGAEVNMDGNNAYSIPDRNSNSSRGPDRCAICLETMDGNKSFIEGCFHSFCFVCLRTWSRVKARCPLCGLPFECILHNVRAMDDYDKYYVSPARHVTLGRSSERWTNRLNWAPRDSSLIASRTTCEFPAVPANNIDSREHVHAINTSVTPPTSLRERFTIPLLSIPQSRDHVILETSRQNLDVPRASEDTFLREPDIVDEHTPRRLSSADIIEQIRRDLSMTPSPEDVNADSRNFCPEVYRQNPEWIYRLADWLNRKLPTLLQDNGSPVVHVLELILSLVAHLDVHSEEFYVWVKPYFRSKTCSFIQEFSSFASSLGCADTSAVHESKGPEREEKKFSERAAKMSSRGNMVDHGSQKTRAKSSSLQSSRKRCIRSFTEDTNSSSIQNGASDASTSAQQHGLANLPSHSTSRRKNVSADIYGPSSSRRPDKSPDNHGPSSPRRQNGSDGISGARSSRLQKDSADVFRQLQVMLDHYGSQLRNQFTILEDVIRRHFHDVNEISGSDSDDDFVVRVTGQLRILRAPEMDDATSASEGETANNNSDAQNFCATRNIQESTSSSSKRKLFQEEPPQTGVLASRNRSPPKRIVSSTSTSREYRTSNNNQSRNDSTTQQPSINLHAQQSRTRSARDVIGDYCSSRADRSSHIREYKKPCNRGKDSTHESEAEDLPRLTLKTPGRNFRMPGALFSPRFVASNPRYTLLQRSSETAQNAESGEELRHCVTPSYNGESISDKEHPASGADKNGTHMRCGVVPYLSSDDNSRSVPSSHSTGRSREYERKNTKRGHRKRKCHKRSNADSDSGRDSSNPRCKRKPEEKH